MGTYRRRKRMPDANVITHNEFYIGIKVVMYVFETSGAYLRMVPPKI